MIKWIKSFFEKEPIKYSDMKYLIVGLGNVGADYDDTRHNVGFEVVDYIANQFEVPFKKANLGDVAEFRHKGRTIVLLKPNTFMNLSGKAVRYWLQNKKIKDRNLLVIVDDKNIDLGRIKLKKKGSDGGHNGLKNINQILGSNVYARLRVGIGSNFSKGRQVEFVLGKWNDKEKEQLPDILKRSSEASLAYATIGIDRAMNTHNN